MVTDMSDGPLNYKIILLDKRILFASGYFFFSCKYIHSKLFVFYISICSIYILFSCIISILTISIFYIISILTLSIFYIISIVTFSVIVVLHELKSSRTPFYEWQLIFFSSFTDCECKLDVHFYSNS